MNECYMSELAVKSWLIIYLAVGYALGVVAHLYFNKLRQKKDGIVEVKRHGYARSYGRRK